MKITDADVVWTPDTRSSKDRNLPNRGAVRVERHACGWQRTHGDLWMPAPYGAPAKDEIRQLLAMFILFNTLVVRDGIDPAKAHAAFLTIDEYRTTISPDAPGAEEAA